MRKVLITGAGGFLGGWLCAELVERDIEVLALDREWRDGCLCPNYVPEKNRITADVEDYESTLRILQEHDVDFVFHLAAQALVQVAATDPIATFRANIQGTWNVLEAARQLRQGGNVKLAGVIVTSSDKAYGDQTELPYMEAFPLKGRFPYDVSKSCADLIAQSYFSSFRLPVCVTRCGNLYGGGDFAYSRVVPGTICSVLRNERPLIRSDGTPIRDYVYVKDAAQALVLIAEDMLVKSDVHGEAFNISVGTPISVIDLVRKILKVMDRADLEPIVQGTASLEIQAQYLSSEKIKHLLKWKPRFDLDRGLAETACWYKQFLSQPARSTQRTTQLARDEA
jgi:CDP-glucose 4,6-dehydratase